MTLFIPWEEISPVNSLDELSQRTSIKKWSELWNYFRRIQNFLLEELELDLNQFAQTLYPPDRPSQWIIETSTRLPEDPVSNLVRYASNLDGYHQDHLEGICVQRRGFSEENFLTKMATFQTSSVPIWKMDPFTADYLIGLLVNRELPSSSLPYLAGFIADGQNFRVRPDKPSQIHLITSTQDFINILIQIIQICSTQTPSGPNFLEFSSLSWKNFRIQKNPLRVLLNEFGSAQIYLSQSLLKSSQFKPSPHSLGKQALALMLLIPNIELKFPGYLFDKYFSDRSSVIRSAHQYRKKWDQITVDQILENEPPTIFTDENNFPPHGTHPETDRILADLKKCRS